jgi:nicotinamide-nucleotide amidase
VPTAELLGLLRDRGFTVAVAESLTGGLVIAELVSVAGASDVVLGGVVAYATELKHSVLGVDADLLAEHGPVHPLVAEQMADGVRHAFAVGGRNADVGLATTGVAGPGPEGGHPAGTVYLGIAVGNSVRSLRLSLDGDRQAVRERTVSELLAELERQLV